VQRSREALYTHADGSSETVTVVAKHSESEGGGYTVRVPSLGRERQTVDGRLTFPPGSPYFVVPLEPEEKNAASAVAAGTLRTTPPPNVPPPPDVPPPEA
jgi:hypothetical protein